MSRNREKWCAGLPRIAGPPGDEDKREGGTGEERGWWSAVNHHRKKLYLSLPFLLLFLFARRHHIALPGKVIRVPLQRSHSPHDSSRRTRKSKDERKEKGKKERKKKGKKERKKERRKEIYSQHKTRKRFSDQLEQFRQGRTGGKLFCQGKTRTKLTDCAWFFSSEFIYGMKQDESLGPGRAVEPPGMGGCYPRGPGRNRPNATESD